MLAMPSLGIFDSLCHAFGPNLVYLMQNVVPDLHFLHDLPYISHR